MVDNWKKKFFVFYIGQAFSILGSSVVQFAIIWYLTIKTKSAVILTTSTIIHFLALALFAPLAGIVADRYNRRIIMILADGFVALSTLCLSILFMFFDNTVPTFLIFVVIALRSVGQTFHFPAMQASITYLVPEDYLTQASAWNNFIESGATLIGPMLGTFLMQIFSMSIVLSIDIVGAVLATICLLFINIPNVVKETEKKNFWNEMKQGMIVMKENRLLMRALPYMILLGIFSFPLMSLFPLLIVTHYNGGIIETGFVQLASSIGMVVISFIIGLLGASKKKMMLISFSIFGCGICSTISGLLPSNFFILLLIVILIWGCVGTLFKTPYYAYIQESTKPEDLGKVSSLLLTIFTLLNPIGLFFSGPISDIIGVANWFTITGIILTITGIFSYLHTKNLEKEYLSSRESK